MILKFLIEKEFKQFLRNPMLPRLIIVFPCIMLLVMPWAANSEYRNINVAVVDNDHSTLSSRLVEKISASTYFRLTDVAQTYPEAMQDIENGTADLILDIPVDFERDLMNGATPGVLLAPNSVNGAKGSIGSSYAASIMSDFSRELRADYGGLFPVAMGNNGSAATSFAVFSQWRYNPHMNYKLFMVPALMVMLLTMICGFMPALNIVSEKENGTIEQINVTPVRKLTFMFGKLIPYWIIGFTVLSIGFMIAWLVYGFTPVGSIGTIYLFAMLFVLSMTGLGLLISNFSATMQQAMFVMFFFIIIFVLMSGLFTPLNSMPQWAQTLAAFNPLKYFIQVMRSVYLKGSVVSDLYRQLAALCGFLIFFNGWAVLSYHKST